VDTWNLIKTERLATADAFGALSEAEWDAPSLCDGWSNRDTLAHIVATAELTTGGFVGRIVRNGFSFNKMVANDIKRLGADEPAQLISRLRAAAPGPNHPPGPVASMLMEIVVHGEDIAFALGKTIHHRKCAARSSPCCWPCPAANPSWTRSPVTASRSYGSATDTSDLSPT
jgi:uncharacterized protein (TIGR03083 family)